MVTAEEKEKARYVLDRLKTASVWQVSEEFPELSRSTLARMTTRSRLLFYAAKRELDDGTIIDCDWEPIITAKEMHALRRASASRLPYRRTGKEKPSRLLTGLGIFYCAYCNRTMKGHTDKKRPRRGKPVTHHCYRCNRYKIRIGERTECKNQSVIKCAEVDDPLLLHVQHTLDRLSDLKAAFEHVAHESWGVSKAVELRDRLAAEEKKRDRLVDRIADGLLTDAEARPTLTRVRDEIDEIKAELGDLDVREPEQLDVMD